jgi:S1-C subfamily serine protease
MNSAASVRSSGFGFRGGSSSASEAFAITIDKAMSIVKEVESGNETNSVHIGDRGILGVSIQSSASSGNPFGGSSGSLNGASVAGVQSGSPAADAGIQAGDTIVSIGNTRISSASQLSTAMSGSHPGDKVSVGWRDSSGTAHTATVALIAGPPA